MKKVLCLMAIATVIGFSASAQDDENNGTSVSVGLEVAMPMGDLKDADAKLGLGGSAKVAFPIMPNGAITVSAGYISFAGKEIDLTPFGGGKIKPKYNMIPLKAGFRYSFPGASGFYVEGQLGYTLASVKVEGSDSDSEGGFTWAPNVGFLLNNKIDISARYESANIKDTKWDHLGFRIAYNFGF